MSYPDFYGDEGFAPRPFTGLPGMSSTAKAAGIATVAGVTARNSRDQASASLGAYIKTLAAIRSDDQLSDQAKRDLIGRAWAALRADLAKLQDQEVGAALAAKQTLETQLFGAPPGFEDPAARLAWDSSYRDAQARFDDLSGPDAQETAIRMWQRAERTGDVPMLKAALTVALERGWGQLIAAYSSVHPESAAVLEQLADIATAFGTTTAGRNFQLRRAAAYQSPPKPPELGMISDWDVARMYGPDGAFSG